MPWDHARMVGAILASLKSVRILPLTSTRLGFQSLRVITRRNNQELSCWQLTNKVWDTQERVKRLSPSVIFCGEREVIRLMHPSQIFCTYLTESLEISCHPCTVQGRPVFLESQNPSAGWIPCWDVALIHEFPLRETPALFTVMQLWQALLRTGLRILIW